MAKDKVEIFCSYSHEDEILFERLKQHLGVLEKQGVISIWHDRRIDPGQDWQAEINDNLKTADVVLLLISPAYLDSEYVNRVEIPCALERHNSGDAVVIPVVIRPALWENTQLNALQALPKDGMAITAWPNQDAAFLDVAKGIRKVVFRLRPMAEQILAVSLATGVIGPLSEEAARIHVEQTVTSFYRIKDFWQAKQGALIAGQLVRIEGTLSQYAPIIVGSPSIIKALHLEIRQQYEKLLKQKGPIFVDYLLMMSAGSLVWRLPMPTFKYVGLYQAIVRNSIPVFIDQKYYQTVAGRLFSDGHPKTVDATVIAEVRLLPQDYFELIGRGLDKPKVVSKSNELNYCLWVDGRSTSIEYLRQTRYLDGDIWVEIEHMGQRRYMTRFCDLSDELEVQTERGKLKRDLNQFFPGARIMHQYDEIDPIFSDHESIDIDEVIGILRDL